MTAPRLHFGFAAAGGPGPKGLLTIKQYVLLAALGATLVAGCSTNPQGAGGTDIDEKTVVTGSRIPVRDASSVKTTTDKSVLEDMQRRGLGGNPGANTH